MISSGAEAADRKQRIRDRYKGVDIEVFDRIDKPTMTGKMPLQIGKTPIVVPRQHQFNEHVNDHQVEFARNVAKRMGTIIEVEDIETLGDVITNYDRIVTGMGLQIWQLD